MTISCTKNQKKTPHRSAYDPSRDTVGKIYRDLHLNSSMPIIEVGDMTNSILPGLVDDINDAIASARKEFDGRPFYIMIHEKKDLQMKDALLRRIFKQLWRPYPEDDTTVFYHDPKSDQTYFCWSLPHWSEMENMLASECLFDHALIEEIKAWKRNDLHHFGFKHDEKGNWVPNPHFKDKSLQKVA